MKKVFLIVSLLIGIVFYAYCSELSEALKRLPRVVSVEELKTNSFFSEKYLIMFEQLIDYDNPKLGTFQQRVFVCHKDFNAPVVFTTEGYGGNYCENNKYMNELCSILVANEVFVEHRYFSKSVPDSIDWQTLTTSNAAADCHAVFESLKKVYKKKWLATGISKGGTTCLLYEMYYPNDMDATIAYVAPVAKGVEDGRHEPFIAKTGTTKDQKKILEFQTELLIRRATLFPWFEKEIAKQKYTFRIPVEEIYDYCVLEFSFAFWQWYGNTERIPTKKDADDKFFNYWMAVSGPEYFSIEGSESTLAAHYMFAHENGYYGYDTKAFDKTVSINKEKIKLLKIESSKGYFNKIFLPENMQTDFLPETMAKLEKFLQTKAKNTILIYGEYDPWSAAAPDVSMNKNVLKIYNEKGNHGSRILSLSKVTQEFVVKKIVEIMN